MDTSARIPGASAQDQVASWLMSGLIVLGSLVLLLSLAWVLHGSTPPPPVEPILVTGAPVDSRSDSFERQIDSPETPTDLEATEFEEVLSQLISHVPTALQAGSHSIGDTGEGGQGQGGEARLPGKAGNNDTVPPFERWEIRFQADGIEQYARLLDQLHMELACVGGGLAQVDYASEFSSKPKKRQGRPQDETRLYFVWHGKNSLADYDRELLSQVNIPTRKRLVLKLIPTELEETLAKLEVEYSTSHGQPDVQKIKKTHFSIAIVGNQVRYDVMSQSYRD